MLTTWKALHFPPAMIRGDSCWHVQLCNCANAFCLNRPSDESCEPQNHQRMNNLQIDESWSVNEVWCLVCGVNHKTEREYMARKKTNSYPDQWWPYPLLPVSRLTLERCVLTHSRSNLLFSISIEFFHTSPGQLRSLGLFTSGCVVNFLFKISSVSISQSPKLLNSWDGKQIMDHDTTSISWEPEDSMTLPNPLFPLLTA